MTTVPPQTSLTPDEERAAFTELFDPSLQRGKQFCLLTVSWYEQWCDYTGFDKDTIPQPSDPTATSSQPSMPPLDDPDSIVRKTGDRPGPINNRPLLQLLDTTYPLHLLHAHVQEHTDFVFLPSACYELLARLYGGGPKIERRVVVRGLHEELVIELHPISVIFTYVDENGRIVDDGHSTSAAGSDQDGGTESSRVRTFSVDTTLRGVVDELRPPFAAAKDGGEKLEGRVWKRRETADKSRNDNGKQTTKKEEERKEQKEDETAGTDKKDDSQQQHTDGDSWELVHEREYGNTLEFLDWTSGVKIAVEYRYPADPTRWCRSSAAYQRDDWRERLKDGDELDALDTQNKWYESVVKARRDNQVHVHFKGWQEKWNEWRDVTSDKLALKSLYTTGARDPNVAKQQARDVSKYNTQGRPLERGTVGLRNLGNTCFMNSILQCLIQTPVLTEYFLEKRYRRELNRANPLGWQGKVAEEYGELISEMWGGQYQVVAPKVLKQVVGEFQPRFSGYQQHDSSEFLSFLLDGLHEDLNRVHKKPVTQPVESNGRRDEVVAKEAWERHLQRNKSIIVDLCQGQFKSTVVCPECRKSSITFDPFLFLQLPIPQQTHSYRAIHYVPSPSTARLLSPPVHSPMVVTLQLQKHYTVADMKAALSVAVGVTLNPATLLLTELYDNKILKAFTQEMAVLDRTKADVLCMYELDELIDNRPNAPEKWTTLQVLQYVNQQGPGGKARLVSVPTVVAVPSHLLTSMPIRELYERVAASRDVLLVRKPAEPIDNGMDVEPSTLPNGSTPATPPRQPTDNGTQHTTDNGTPYEFEIVLMDRQARVVQCDIPYPRTDSDVLEIDLIRKGEGHNGMTFVCMHPASFPYQTTFYQPPAATSASSSSAASLLPSMSRKRLDIYDCLQAFTREEVLRKSESWYCSNCKAHQQATKRIDLWRSPDILVLHLKRFSFTSTYRDKLDMRVEFPIEQLDLSAFVKGSSADETQLYDLYAVSNHYGGLGGGHYTAYAKNLKNAQWYNLDDSSVSPVHPSQVVTEAAYVLFYKRRGMTAVAAGHVTGGGVGQGIGGVSNGSSSSKGRK